MGKHILHLPKLLCLAGLALLLAACVPSANPGAGSATSVPAGNTAVPTGAPSGATAVPPSGASTTPGAATPSAGATRIIITAVPATPGALTPLPGGIATSTPPATPGAGQGLVVTQADDGKIITLKVGQRFLLDLGDGYNWTPTVVDPRIVSRVIGITVIRGAQGVYEAHAMGTTNLLANGEPGCRQSKPACGMPNRLFAITIVVES